MYDNQRGIYTTRLVDEKYKIEVLLMHSIRPFMTAYEFRSVSDAKEYMNTFHKNLAYEKEEWFDNMVKSHSTMGHRST